MFAACSRIKNQVIKERGNHPESPQHASLEHITQRIQAFAEDDEADRDLQFAEMNIEEGNDQLDDNTMHEDGY